MVKLGTLYLDGDPQVILNKCLPRFKSGELRIGDTKSIAALKWEVVGNLLVSRSVILTNISWTRLDEEGLIFGKDITIDGVPFHIRAPKLIPQEGDLSEWEEILKAAGDDDETWNWWGCRFWGQEAPPGGGRKRFVAGMSHANHLDLVTSSGQSSGIGYRPILEHIQDGDKRIVVLKNGRILYGKITGSDDYDITMKTKAMFSKPAVEAGAAVKAGREVIVTKEAIQNILL